jgi:hypothetical protein
MDSSVQEHGRSIGARVVQKGFLGLFEAPPRAHDGFMSSHADVRRLALGHAEASEDLHRARPAFRVRGKIFCLLGSTGRPVLFRNLQGESIAVVKLDREDQLNMAAAFPRAVAPTESYGHHGWTYLNLPELDEAALALILRLAWSHVAPARLRKMHQRD